MEINELAESLNHMKSGLSGLSEFAKKIQNEATPEKLSELDPEKRAEVEKSMKDLQAQFPSFEKAMDQFNKAQNILTNYKARSK